MKAKNFKLFMGCLGHGLTVCNSAVMEAGDYKTIAWISPAGNIKLYVSKDYIPESDYSRIRQTAARMRNDFTTEFNKLRELNPGRLYERMLDILTISELVNHPCRQIKGLQASIDSLKDLYFERS